MTKVKKHIQQLYKLPLLVVPATDNNTRLIRTRVEWLLEQDHYLYAPHSSQVSYRLLYSCWQTTLTSTACWPECGHSRCSN